MTEEIIELIHLRRNLKTTILRRIKKNMERSEMKLTEKQNWQKRHIYKRNVTR